MFHLNCLMSDHLLTLNLITRHLLVGLAPPIRVREGVVTDSSIELLWDSAPGHGHGYEVICLNCDHSQMVN